MNAPKLEPLDTKFGFFNKSFLMAVVIVCLVPLTGRSQDKSEIFPVNFREIYKTAIVETSPSDFRAGDGRYQESTWRPERWRLLLRRMANPSIFEKAIASYEKYGYRKSTDDISYDEIEFVDDFVKYCYPKQMPRPWFPSSAQEFERTRTLRQFIDGQKQAFEKYAVKLPLRIGAIREIELGDYDRSKQVFSLKTKGRSAFEVASKAYNNKSNYILQYESDITFDRILELPMPTAEAEALLKRLKKDKTVYVVDTHLLVRIEKHPTKVSGATAILEKQEIAVFEPGSYSKPLFVKKPVPISQLANTPTAAQQSEEGGAVEWKNDATAKRMRKLCAEMNLFNINGIPISGILPFSVLDKSKEASFKKGQQILADRITLHEHPEILSQQSTIRGLSEVPMFVRLLGNTTMAPYVDRRGSNWKGSDEFQTRKSRAAFFQAHTDSLKKLALAPPFRFRTLNTTGIRKYDFEKQGFEVEWHSEQRDGVLQLQFPYADQEWYLEKISETYQLKMPQIWPVKEAEAEKISARLAMGRGRYKQIYSSTVFDILNAPNTLPARSNDAQRNPHQGNQSPILPRQAGLYEDNLCRQLLWDVPVTVTPKSMLESRESSLNSGLNEFYLWQPQVQVALLNKFAPEKVSRIDWVEAALDTFQDDAEYYRFGQVAPRRVQSYARNSLLSNMQQDSEQPGPPIKWSASYVPFFPRTFFGATRLLDVRNYADRISNEQLKFFKSWLVSYVDQAGDEYQMRSKIKVDREDATAIILMGDTQREEWFTGPDYDDLGMTGKMNFPPNSSHRHFIDEPKPTKFSVAFPAVEDHLVFPIDLDSLPVFNRKNEDIHEGNLVVKIEKIDVYNTEHQGQQAMVHVRPIRFEARVKANQDARADDPGEKIAPILFSVDMDIAKMTQNDLAQKQDADRMAAEEAAMAERKRREQEQREQEEKSEREFREQERLMLEKAEQRNKERRAQERIERQSEEEAMEKQRIEVEKANNEADARLQRQKLENDRRLAKNRAEADAANKRANDLMKAGYAYEDIDWVKGEPLSGKTAKPLPAPHPNVPPEKTSDQKGSSWTWLIGLIFVGVVSFSGWRFLKSKH